MVITAINGNLQIGDTTAVALDPTTPGQITVTNFSTGGAGLSQGTWVSQNQFGPDGFLPNPSNGFMTAVPPLPGTPAGTPAPLYRIWQNNYATGSTGTQYLPEVSNDGGFTWQTIPTPGLPTNPGPTSF